MKLYPDQVEAKKKVIASIRTGNTRIGFMAPCAWGKTVFMSHLTEGAIKKENRVWIVVDSVELIDQTRETLEAHGISSGVIQGYHDDTDYSKMVQVVTAQTITKRWDKFRLREHLLPKLVLVDEFHVKHKAHDELMDKIGDKAIVIGFSATPITKGLGSKYHDLVIGSTVKQLLSEDRLSPIVGYACDTPDMKGVSTSGGDYAIGQTAKKVNTTKLRGNLIKNWVKLGENRKTIVFCVNIQHSIDVANEFADNHILTAQIDGKTHKGMRAQIIEDFKNDEYKVLVSVGVIIKGFNVVDIGCIIDAQPTKSMSRHIQKLGRGMRKNPIYDNCIILDHAGNLLRNGFPEDFEPSEMCNGEKGKVSDKNNEPEERLPKACPKCQTIKVPGQVRCPNCGYENKIDAHVENDNSTLERIKKKLTPAEKRNKEFTLKDKEWFYGGLLRYAKNKKYKDGWAENKYREHFSVWPNKIKQIHIDVIPEIVKKFITAGNIRYANRRK